MQCGNDLEAREFMSRLVNLLASDIGKDREPEYLHWDRLRLKNLPDGIRSHKEWWLLIKLRRSSLYRKLPLLTADSTPFVYWLPDPIQQRLHQVDQQASGRVQIAEEVANPNTRDRYLVSSLMEEAITSSQLEGASTTQKVAKAMLREKRRPRNKSEQMIFNNYRAMGFIREVAGEPLTKELIFELHKIVTERTLDDQDSEGRLRRSDEHIVVYDGRDQTLLHEPPAADQLEERLSRICDFANSKSDGGEFLHPVVQSIVLHFMIGYDHPFVDGNGRAARALFYWSMAKHGYWMMEYVSISKILRNAPSKYARAYLYTENDDNDLTYFVDYNIRVIIRAVKSLQDYLARKAAEVREVELSISNSLLAKLLNHRQLALISHALRNPGALYYIESHRQSHGVTYPTARSDLLKLVELGVLDQQRIGNAFAFRAVQDLQDRLPELKVG